MGKNFIIDFWGLTGDQIKSGFCLSWEKNSRGSWLAQKHHKHDVDRKCVELHEE